MSDRETSSRDPRYKIIDISPRVVEILNFETWWEGHVIPSIPSNTPKREVVKRKGVLLTPCFMVVTCYL